MKRAILQLLALLLVMFLCLGCYLLVKHALDLPFRATNDALHAQGSFLTLDFLIPGGAYINEKMTIGEVIDMRFKSHAPLYEKAIDQISDNIPLIYISILCAMIFFFFVFSFMAFFRVFTFMGYARALRISLLLAGITYYFLPDLSIRQIDDYIFVGSPLLIILLRIYFIRRKKKTRHLRV